MGLIGDAIDSEGLERFADGTRYAGWFLAYAQAIISMAGVDYLGSTAPDPLTRTRSHEANGDSGTFTVQMRFSIAKSPVLDCLRLVLRGMGMDFDIPDEGPMADSEVRFLIRNREPGHITTFQPFVGVGTGEFVTDPEGRATYSVYGLKQQQPLSDEAEQVSAVFNLIVYGKLNANDLFKDIPAVLGEAAGGAELLVTLPATLVLRTEWAAPGGFDVRYLDWMRPCRRRGFAQACTADATGTVEVTMAEETLSPDGGVSSRSELHSTLQVSMNRSAQEPDEFHSAGTTHTTTYHDERQGSCGTITTDIQGWAS